MYLKTGRIVMVSPPAGEAGKAQIKQVMASFDASRQEMSGFAQDDHKCCAASNHVVVKIGFCLISVMPLMVM